MASAMSSWSRRGPHLAGPAHVVDLEELHLAGLGVDPERDLYPHRVPHASIWNWTWMLPPAPLTAMSRPPFARA